MIRFVRRGSLRCQSSGTQQHCGAQQTNRDVLDTRIFARPLQIRPSSSTRPLQLDSLPRFFHPSRPDFLPKKSDDDQIVTNNVAISPPKEDIRQSLKRFLPLGGAKPNLPSPSTIDNSHAPLYTSLVKREVDVAWKHFSAHLRDLAEDTSTLTIDSELFDSLFWILAVERQSTLTRQEEIFGRLQILSEYATSQGDYGLTRLQFHRTIYLWTTLWEQCDRRKLPFHQNAFMKYVLFHLNEVDGALTSRIMSRMLNKCDNSKTLKNVHSRIKAWLKSQQRNTKREESWEGSSDSAMQNDQRHFPLQERRLSDPLMWEHLLETCVRIQVSGSNVSDDRIKAAGLFALNQREVDCSLDIVSQFVAIFSNSQLFALLPVSVREGANKIDINQGSITAAEFETQIDEERQHHLVDVIGFVLATRTDYRVAQYLLDSADHKTEKQRWVAKRTEVFAAAMSACGKLSLESTDPNWSLRHLETGLRLFMACNWPERRAKEVNFSKLVQALSAAIIFEEKRAIQSDDRWMLLLRQFSTVLLTYEARSNEQTKPWKIQALSSLLRLHIKLRDYAFAKRLFLVDSVQENRTISTSPFQNHHHFLWLFHSSLIENDLRFATQLFFHWTTMIEEGDQSSDIPIFLVQMYTSKLMMNGQQHAIQILEKYFRKDLDRGLDTLHKPHQVCRMMRSVFFAGPDYVQTSLLLANSIISHWKNRMIEVGDWKTLLQLYSIALKRSSGYIDDADELLPSRIFDLFHDFREEFSKNQSKRKKLVGEEWNDVVRTIYHSALRALVESKTGEETYEMANTWLSEMQNQWRVGLDWKLWEMKIQASFAGTDVDLLRTKNLFLEVVDRADEQKESAQLSPEMTARLMLALADKGFFYEALYEVLSRYRSHAAPLSPIESVIVEGAGIVVLQKQGKIEEALNKAKELLNQKFDKNVYRKTTWLPKLIQVKEELEREVKEKRMHEMRAVSSTSSIERKEDRQRSSMFGALASGQPWGRKQ